MSEYQSLSDVDDLGWCESDVPLAGDGKIGPTRFSMFRTIDVAVFYVMRAGHWIVIRDLEQLELCRLLSDLGRGKVQAVGTHPKVVIVDLIRNRLKREIVLRRQQRSDAYVLKGSLRYYKFFC